MVDIERTLPHVETTKKVDTEWSVEATRRVDGHERHVETVKLVDVERPAPHVRPTRGVDGDRHVEAARRADIKRPEQTEPVRRVYIKRHEETAT